MDYCNQYVRLKYPSTLFDHSLFLKRGPSFCIGWSVDSIWQNTRFASQRASASRTSYCNGLCSRHNECLSVLDIWQLLEKRWYVLCVPLLWKRLLGWFSKCCSCLLFFQVSQLLAEDFPLITQTIFCRNLRKTKWDRQTFTWVSGVATNPLELTSLCYERWRAHELENWETQGVYKKAIIYVRWIAKWKTVKQWSNTC